MEVYTKHTFNTFIDDAYLFIRSGILKTYILTVLFNTVALCFLELTDLRALYDLLVPTITISVLIILLSSESYGVSRKKLLFIFSELMNIGSYFYGIYINDSNRDLYLIICTVSTCGFQLVGSSNFENIIIIFKLVFVWYLGPILLGHREVPNEKTPYISLIYLLLVLSAIFTYRKKLEDQYVQALNKIEKIRKQLSNLIKAIPESILICSIHQEVMLYNDACQLLFQVDTPHAIKEKLLSMKYSTYNQDYEDQESMLYEAILKYLYSEQESEITFGINEVNNRSYEWRGTKSEWDDIKVVILTARDITNLISYERAKAEAESKTILLRTISHEIRTPTNTIVNLTDLMLESHPDDRDIDKIKIINISSKLLLSLINDMLDFSKIMADCFTINKSSINLRNLIKETYSLFTIQAVQKQVDFRFTIDPLLPDIIETDPNRLRQVIVNLLSNSLKFTIHGKIRLEALLTESSTMLIRVLDTGIGIPPHKISHLFEAFNTTQDSTLNPQGCGLGLYIANKFVNLLGGGPIKVSSKMHEGSVFWFEVDIGILNRIVIDSSEEELQEECIENEKTCEIVPRNNLTHDSFTPIRAELLIVDDNEFNILIMRNFLTSAGYQFEEARSGAEAIDKVVRANAKGYSIKVIVMDFQMPDMSGPEASSEIYRLHQENMLESFPHIIGYSSEETEDMLKVFEESGMKECLSKSSSKNAFLSLIKKYLGK
jgi:signal transduction histidine kinase/CheY-like chemotaxis protein